MMCGRCKQPMEEVAAILKFDCKDRELCAKCWSSFNKHPLNGLKKGPYHGWDVSNLIDLGYIVP